jgi:pyruvate/2-oxoglutarate dehydrogenase complex dihydrolipoamide dehydrogenase (E3) component
MALSKRGDRVVVGLACKGDEPVAEGCRLLLAVARVPNTHDLGLGEAGIEADARDYIKLDDQCRTSAEGVWAMEICIGRGAFTHTSWNDHEIVAAILFDSDPRRIADRIPCYALFIDPRSAASA